MRQVYEKVKNIVINPMVCDVFHADYFVFFIVPFFL